MNTFANLHCIKHSVVADALAVLRMKSTSTVEFRARLGVIARALAYEATRSLPLVDEEADTPVSVTTVQRMRAQVIATPILRAGLGMLDGFLEVIPWAATGFIGVQRNEETLLPHEYYRNVPNISAAHFFLLDPMLATGGSICAALRRLPTSAAASVTLLSIIAAPEGVAAISEEFPDVTIFTASLDERLDDRGFIIPGLGDAGDRLCDTC